MHDSATDVPAQGRRVRRWLARGLLVAGSTLAATAAGWLISTASASATTMPPGGSDAPGSSQPAQSGEAHGQDVDTAQAARQALSDLSDRAHAAGGNLDDLRSATRPVTEPVSQTVQGTAELIRHPQDGLRAAAADATRAWQQTTRQWQQTVSGLPLPDEDTLSQTVTGVAQPAGDDTATGLTAEGTTGPVSGDLAAQPGPRGSSTPATAQQPERAAAVPHAADPAATQSPDHGLPGLPDTPAPVDHTPGVVPGGPGGSSGQGGSGTGPGFAALTPTALVSDAALRLPSWQDVSRSHGASERQPGTTPD